MGNTEPGDGYRYRGRGYIQLTGRENYRGAGAALRLELEGNPDLAALPENAARIAVWFWQKKVPVKERENVTAATHRVNGGEVGLAERYERNGFWNDTLTPEFLADLDAGRIRPETKLDHVVSSSAGAPHQNDLNSATVRTLQETLNALGYTDAYGQALGIDGRYGPSTRYAIKAFQDDHNLNVDDVVGPNTWAALQEATRTASVTANASPIVNAEAMAELPTITLPQLAHPNLDATSIRTLQQHERSTPSASSDQAQTDVINQRTQDASPPLPQGLPTLREFQSHLTILGLTGPTGQPLSMTGKLDPDTRHATQHFQSALGLDATGLPDRATFDLAREHAAVITSQRTPTMTRMPSPSAQAESPAPQPTAMQSATATQEAMPSHAHAAAQATHLATTRTDELRQRQENAQRQADLHHESTREATRATETSRTAVHEPTALWTSEPLPPPRVPATFADPAHPQHYRYATLLEQVQEAPALQSYTADQHARIAAGLTYMTDQHKAFVIQDLRAIEIQGNTLIVTDHLKIGQDSEVLHGNLGTMLTKTPEETASAWREWALPKQSALSMASPLAANVDPQPVPRTDVRHPQEPHHAMFLEARQKLGAAYAAHGMTRDPEQLDREAARVTVTLRDRQFDQVPTLMLACEPDGRFSAQPGLRAVSDFSMVKFSGEDLKQAPPVEQSSQTLVQVEQRLQEQAMAFEQRLAQQAGLGRTP